MSTWAMRSTKAATVPRYRPPTLPPVPARLHLVRHGEVHNPGGVVYAGLPGFSLSTLGRAQAAAAAEYLADSGATVLVTSPLDRAQETAEFVARRLGIEPVVAAGLTEWGLATRWAGTAWTDLDRRFPGELAAYAADPATLPFSPESLAALADRTHAVVTRVERLHPGAVVVAVSHQDPIQALRRALCCDGFADFHSDKPGHATVITLEPFSGAWREIGSWSPDMASPAFPPLPLPGTT